jgi:peptide deformylase
MKIVNFPHPSLRHRAVPLTEINARVKAQAEEMLELMHAHKGLALAAPQVVLPYRLIVMDIRGEDDEVGINNAVFINPEILDRKGSIESDEGCLSFPGLYQKVRRAKTCQVRGYNLSGELVEKTVNDLEARVWQHEVDHLDGVLYIDKMGLVAKMAARASVKEFEREFKRAQERGEIASDADLERLLTALESEA